jgi:hypothetical protein
MGKRGPGAPPLEVRFWEKVEKTDTCWLWTGATTKKGGEGYGQIAISGKIKAPAHRVSYELARGPIQEGMFLDHICMNKLCVNPDHLREVTPKQNSENLPSRSPRNISGHRNVQWNHIANRWVVYVTSNGVRHYGGCFADREEAAEAAKALRNRLFTHNDADREAA